MQREDEQVGLGREAMVSTALRLLDEVGLDGLTVRRLAAELDVQSPALYWHFRNKQDLLEEMSAAIQRSASTSPGKAEPWPDWVARRARERRQLLLAHRDGARLVAATRADAAVLQMFDRELVALVGAGFTPAQALQAIFSISHYVTGFVLEEQADQQRSAQTCEGLDDPIRHAEVLSSEAFTTLATAIRDGPDLQSEQAFDFGLRMLVDGMTAVLARAA